MTKVRTGLAVAAWAVLGIYIAALALGFSSGLVGWSAPESNLLYIALGLPLGLFGLRGLGRRLRAVASL